MPLLSIPSGSLQVRDGDLIDEPATSLVRGFVLARENDMKRSKFILENVFWFQLVIEDESLA